jgi:endogenous inhibitor of DNA gyrase (YacG/DUF329 family)
MMLQPDRKLICPDCGSPVNVTQASVEGTASRGGSKTVGPQESAKCPECGREFKEAEIDELSTWS